MSSLPTFSLGPQSSSLQLEFSKETLWDRSCLRPRCGPFAEELRAGPLDFATFYLDDGVVAGDILAVAAAIAHAQRYSPELALRLNLQKCEVIAIGRVTDAQLAPHLPNNMLRATSRESLVHRGFELLGAGIGDATFVVEAHTAARAAKANLLLQHGGHRRIGGPASRAQAPAVLCCPHPHDPRAEGCTQTLKPKACKTSTTKPGVLSNWPPP